MHQDWKLRAALAIALIVIATSVFLLLRSRTEAPQAGLGAQDPREHDAAPALASSSPSASRHAIPLSDAPGDGTGSRSATEEVPFDLEVVTVDQATGEPADPCDVRVGLASSRRMGQLRSSGQSRMVSRPGPGRVRIAPVPQADILLLITPRDGRHARFVFSYFATGAPGQRVTVPLPLERHRTLRVLDANGAAIAGTVFQLVRPDVPPELPSWHPFPPPSLPVVGIDTFVAGHAARIRTQGGVTDARGETVLYGARGVGYELVLAAPSRLEEVHKEILVDDALEPLVVVLFSGCEVFGKIGPEVALTRMARPTGGQNRVYPPAIFLASLDTSVRDPTGQVQVAEDGTYALRGVPAGSYRMHMYWYDSDGSPHHENLAEVKDLRTGERRQVDPFLGMMIRTRISGWVTWNGRPWSSGKLELRNVLSKPPEATPLRAPVSAKTDAEGRFECEVEPGTWCVALPVRKSAIPQCMWLPGSDRVQIGAGRPAEGTFALKALSLILKVVDASGRPASSEKLTVFFEGLPLSESVTTDASGRATIECVPKGSARILLGWPSDNMRSLRCCEVTGSEAETTCEVTLAR